MVPRRSGLYASVRSFWRLCLANPDLSLERSARGEVIVMAPACMDSGMRNASLTAQLWAWNQASKLGFAFDSSAGFTLPNGAIRAPDATWIARDRWTSIPIEARKTFTPIVPDFVVEISSPSDTLVDSREKMREYIEQGVRLGWLLAPATGLVEIYRSGRHVESLEHPTTLSGEEVLPGFVLDLKGILFD
ncbi:Uma2 family endonuclease [Tundrisphaera lichenicola]|uniref:Uma2 family endonuclease n=1 Tax=Tundrisphaera lichenicola TaxID=2029860 RepID=UPI003EBC9A4D